LPKRKWAAVLADLRLEIELHSFDSVLFACFVDFVLSEHGIDVAGTLVEDVVKQSNWSVIVRLRGVLFDCEVIRLREYRDAEGPVTVILR
jgi:hypothetical protein